MTDTEAIRAQLSTALERGAVHSGYLFEGGPGTPKTQTALWFAGQLLDDPRAQAAADDAEARPAHPDLKWVEPEAGVIRVGAIRRLQGELSLVAHEGGRRVALILDADFMRIEAANALLKLLEEPPPGAVILLVATSAEALPPTVRSRVLRYRFAPWPEEELRAQLEREGLGPEDAWLAAALGGGSPAGAADWAAGQLEDGREIREWLEAIDKRPAGEILGYAESFRGGEKGRQRAELLISVHSALARRETQRASEAGDSGAASYWIGRFEVGERARREMRRRNLNPQMVVEGLLLDLRASRPA